VLLLLLEVLVVRPNRWVCLLKQHLLGVSLVLVLLLLLLLLLLLPPSLFLVVATASTAFVAAAVVLYLGGPLPVQVRLP
jgi:hypothetical protein